jgi:hypothetical protein
MKKTNQWTLVLLAVIMFLIATPFGISLEAVKGRTKRRVQRIALSIDQLTNTCYPVLATKLFIKYDEDSSHKFGNEDETLSSVLGKNARIDNLSKFGKFVCKMLNNIDNNHCANAIEKDESI